MGRDAPCDYLKAKNPTQQTLIIFLIMGDLPAQR